MNRVLQLFAERLSLTLGDALLVGLLATALRSILRGLTATFDLLSLLHRALAVAGGGRVAARTGQRGAVGLHARTLAGVGVGAGFGVAIGHYF